MVSTNSFKKQREQLTGRLEGSTTDKETVNVGLLGELAAVLLVDAAAVEDAGLVGDLVADAAEEVTDGLVDLLSLLDGGNLASADGPDGLVGDDDVAPVGDLGLEGLDLGGDELDGLAGLAGLEALTAAPDDLQAVLGGVLGLGGDDIIGLAEDGSALRVAEDDPVDVAVLELSNGDLASVGTVGLVEDVLGSDLDVGADGLADEREVEGGRGDDDLCRDKSVDDAQNEGQSRDDVEVRGRHTSVLVEGGVVEVGNNLLDGRHGAVPIRLTCELLNTAS